MPLARLRFVLHFFSFPFHLCDVLLESLDLLLVGGLDRHLRVKLLFEPFQLRLQLHYSGVLVKLAVLLCGFGFQKLKLLFDFDHVKLVSVQKVVFVHL